MYTYTDEIAPLAALLHVEPKELNAIFKYIPNGDYCTFTLISVLGQSIYRVSYGSFESVLDPVEHKFNVSYLGISITSATSITKG